MLIDCVGRTRGIIASIVPAAVAPRVRLGHGAESPSPTRRSSPEAAQAPRGSGATRRLQHRRPHGSCTAHSPTPQSRGSIHKHPVRQRELLTTQPQISTCYQTLVPLFNERLRRLFAAMLAQYPGRGGIRAVSEVTGVAHGAIDSEGSELESISGRAESGNHVRRARVDLGPLPRSQKDSESPPPVSRRSISTPAACQTQPTGQRSRPRFAVTWR